MCPCYRSMRQKSWISRQAAPNLSDISLHHRDFVARIPTILLSAAVIRRYFSAARPFRLTSAAQHPRHVSGRIRLQWLCSAVLLERTANSYHLSAAMSRHRMQPCFLEINFTQTPPYLSTNAAMRVARAERLVMKAYAQSQYQRQLHHRLLPPPSPHLRKPQL